MSGCQGIKAPFLPVMGSKVNEGSGTDLMQSAVYIFGRRECAKLEVATLQRLDMLKNSQTMESNATGKLELHNKERCL